MASSAAPVAEDDAAKRWRLVGLAVAFLVPFAVYLYTLSPSLNFEDAAEFALGAASLGVDHPSGYPLQTLAGHLFTYLPFGAELWRVNVASAFFMAVAAAFVFLITWALVATVVPRPGPRAATTWLAAGLFAFARAPWSQAVIAEVYALNAAAVALAVWLGIGAAERRDGRRFLAFAFVAGLAAANAPLSLLVTGTVGVYGWACLRRDGDPYVLTVRAAFLFALALSLYLYLPLRASREPPVNWGTPATLPTFLDHVGRREYGSYFWPRFRFLGYHALELGRSLLGQYGPGVGVLAPVGVIWLLRRRAPAAGILAVLVALTGPIMLFPLVGLSRPTDLFELEVWYIAFFLLAAPFAGAAAGALVHALRKRPTLARAATAALALLPLYPLIYNYAPASHRGRTFALEHTRNLLRTYPYQTLMAFPFNMQLGIFEEAYLHVAQWRRADVVFVDPRNLIYNDLPAVQRAPRYILEPDAAGQWWRDFGYGLVAGRPGRPVFYNAPDGDVAAWGVDLEPFGLVYYARAKGEPPPPGGAPWRRYEYAGFRAVARSLGATRARYEPTSYRTWAMYYVLAAEYCFARGRDDVGLRNLNAARAGGPHDWALAWLVFTEYLRNGYAEEALALGRDVLPRVSRLRYDNGYYRRQYADLLSGIGAAYLQLGNAAHAAPYFRESSRVYPDQPDLAPYLDAANLKRMAREAAATRAK